MADQALLRLYLLGGFRAEGVAGLIAPDAWHGRPAKNLVKLLALAPGHSLHGDVVADRLWPDRSASLAAGMLRKAIHFARHALDENTKVCPRNSVVVLTDAVISLAPARIWIDVDHVRCLATNALQRGILTRLQEATDSFSGQLLPEDLYEEWTLQPRQDLTNLELRVRIALADRAEQDGNLPLAIESYSAVLASDPVREDVLRALMILLARTGQRDLALRQYKACRDSVLAELEVEPESDTQDLRAAILAGAFSATVAPRDGFRQDRVVGGSGSAEPTLGSRESRKLPPFRPSINS